MTPTAPAEAPLAGTVLDGRYELRECLGEGGMGLVYRARHVRLNKDVAVKILQRTREPAALARFEREARAASAVKHSNVVDITDFGVLPDGRAYLAMELLEGQTLGEALRRGPFDPERARRIGVQIARGLAAVHARGIVHRDLKPDNVFLLAQEGEERVKIVDFGIAKTADGGRRLTQTGMVVGTPDYMAPEQATDRELDARADQYALGCILYEMLAGVPVFEGRDRAALLFKHVYEAPVPLRERRPELPIPAALEAVTLRALAKDPEERFPSMEALEQALAAAAQPEEARSGAPVSARRPLWLPLGLALCLASFAAARSLSVRRPPAPAASGARPAVAAALPAPQAPVPEPPPAPLLTMERAAARPAHLRVLFLIDHPPDADVDISCAPERKQRCRYQCTLLLREGDTCVVSRPGFAPRSYRYASLRALGRGGKVVRQRVALEPLLLDR